MRLFTLVVICLFFVAALNAQEVNGRYYRSGVDNILQLPCMKQQVIELSEIEYDADFIRFPVVEALYNKGIDFSKGIKRDFNRVLFVLAKEHGEYVEIRSKGFCTLHLTVPRSELAGTYYGLLESQGCQSVIEFSYQENMVIAATLHTCCDD